MTETGFCRLCEPPRRVALTDLLEHFRLVHGQTVEIATWPDGEPVIVDETLEPADFEEAE